MKCHAPGTAWQKAWRRPSGSTSGASGRREDDARGAQRERHDARAHRAHAHRARRLVPAARHHRRARRSPVSAAAVGRDMAGHLRPLEGRRQPLARDLERPSTSLDQSRAGRSNSSVPEPSALSIAAHAGEAEPHVVLRQQHVPRLRVDLRLVVAHPEDLRRGEAGQRVVARARGSAASARRARGSRRTRAPVRWSFQRIAGRSTSPRASSSTRPCIWPVSPTAATSAPGRPGVGERLADARRPSRPPLVRVLLGPERPRRLERERRGRGGHHRALLVDRAAPWRRSSRRRCRESSAASASTHAEQHLDRELVELLVAEAAGAERLAVEACGP